MNQEQIKMTYMARYMRQFQVFRYLSKLYFALGQQNCCKEKRDPLGISPYNVLKDILIVLVPALVKMKFQGRMQCLMWRGGETLQAKNQS